MCQNRIGNNTLEANNSASGNNVNRKFKVAGHFRSVPGSDLEIEYTLLNATYSNLNIFFCDISNRKRSEEMHKCINPMERKPHLCHLVFTGPRVVN